MVIRHGGNKARLKGSLATFDKPNRDTLTYNNHLVIDDWENTHMRYFIFAKNGFFEKRKKSYFCRNFLMQK